MSFFRATGLAVTVLGIGLWFCSASAQTSQSQRTFVMVHGANSSIAIFLQIESILEGQGHRVYLASLTGLGDRAHLQSPAIRLETNIQDVVGLIETRDLHDIYLVGQSYGGMVITGAWDRVRDRVHHIVYLDAFVPENGHSAHDYSVGVGEMSAFARDIDAAAAANDGLVPSRRVRGRGQSLYTFFDPLELRNGPLPENTSRTYVRAVGNTQRDPDPTFAQFAEKYRNDPRWNYYEIETGHGISQQDPEGLARILLELE